MLDEGRVSPVRTYTYSGLDSEEGDDDQEPALRLDLSEEELELASPSPPTKRVRSVVVVPEGSRLATRPQLVLPKARPPLAERDGSPHLPPSPPHDRALDSVLSRLGPPVSPRKAGYYVTNDEPKPDRRSRLRRERTARKRAVKRRRREEREWKLSPLVTIGPFQGHPSPSFSPCYLAEQA